MKNCTFLIVTPVLNGAEFIEECILSVKEAFKLFDFVHFIVDGGSTDCTEEIIENNKYDNLCYLKMPGSTMYQAINKGIGLVEAEYFYQINVDDLVLPETPNIVYRYFNSDDSIDVISGSCLTINIESNYCKILVPTKDHFRIDKVGTNLFISQPSTFIRYEVLIRLGGYDQSLKYAGDTELWLRLIKEGYKFVNIKKCLSIDRVHNKCVRKSLEHIREYENVHRTYLNNKYFLPLIRIRNAMSYVFTQVLAMIHLSNFIQSGFQYYGSLFFRIIGVFFTTKHAGIMLNYSFINGAYGFKGRIW